MTGEIGSSGTEETGDDGPDEKDGGDEPGIEEGGDGPGKNDAPGLKDGSDGPGKKDGDDNENTRGRQKTRHKSSHLAFYNMLKALVL